MTSAFVGRTRELAILEAALDGARRGIGGLVLVSGEPGIGKSRLVDRFCAAAPDAFVLWGSCWDEGGAPTYWPWVQVLRGAATSGGRDAVQQLSACLAPLGLDSPQAPLGLGSPSPHGESSRSTDGEGSSVERFALFDAVTQVLHAVAERNPLLVVLEDLHAGGYANALLLDFVARHSRHTPMVLVGTYRDVEIRLDAELAGIVDRLEAAATTMTLTPFSEREVSELAAEVLPDVPPGLVPEVMNRTQGNPLFVAQVLAQRHRDGERGVEAPVPAALRQAILRRAERATAAGTPPEFLNMAAVAGAEVDLALLGAVLGVPVDALSAAAERACEAGLLRRTAEGYAFPHSLVRDALYGGLGATQRAGCHLRVARQLEARGRHPALVARHYLAAWPAGGADEAAHHAQLAGDEAMSALASEDAVGLYRQALMALGRSGADRTRARCEVRLSIAAALQASGRLQEARREAELASVLADQLGDAELVSRAALQGSEHLDFNAVDRSAIAGLRRADASWAGAASPWRARVLARLAVAVATSDQRASTDAAEQAEAVAVQVGEPATLAEALSARLHANWGRHDPAAALASARRIQELVPDSVAGHLWCAVFALEEGSLDLAVHAAAEVDRIGADPRRPTVRYLALSRRSTLAAVRGDLDEALELANQAWDLGRRCALPDADAVYWGQLFVVWRRRGLETALADRMEQILRTLVEHSSLRTVHEAALVQILLAKGETPDARRRHARLVAQVPTLAHDMVRVFTLALLAENCVAFSDAPSAEILYDALEPYADRWAVAAGAVACLGSLHRPLAALAALLGRATSARGHLQAADASERSAGISSDELNSGAELSFVREGSVWTVHDGSTVVRLPDSRGLGYLAELVRHPGRDIAALQLAMTPAGGSSAGRLSLPAGSDPVLDATAKSAYKMRLRELDGEIDEAESWNDPARLEALQAERDALIHELTTAFGLGGRPRRLGSESERARVNVTRAIRTAIRNVGAQAPDLGARLDAAIRTGTACRYDP